MKIDPPIYIYIPPGFWPPSLPVSPDENWPGFGLGMYTWTIQTYLRLRATAFPCELVNELPSRGILLVDHNHLRVTRLKPNHQQLIICLKQDGLRYPYAQCHIVQNPQDAQKKSNYYYIPHWPQPGLIERRSERGNCFENIAFFGHSNNLAPELKQPNWQRSLKSMDLSWRAIANENHWSDYSKLNYFWNDYSDIDAIVAIRSFGIKKNFQHKPATKLYNAWLAGVPAILGYESAFRSEGKPGINYLESTTLDSALKSLDLLANHVDFRHELVTQGRQAVQAFTATQTVERWRSFLQKVAIPAFEDWCCRSRSWQWKTLEKSWLKYKFERATAKAKQYLLNH